MVGAPAGGEWYKLITGDRYQWEVEGATLIDAIEAKALHNRRVVFVDVVNSWYESRIPGAYFLELWFSEGYLFNQASLGQLATFDQEIVIYASNSKRYSADACALAVSRGFKKIYYFRGGLKTWEEAGSLSIKVIYKNFTSAHCGSLVVV